MLQSLAQVTLESTTFPDEPKVCTTLQPPPKLAYPKLRFRQEHPLSLYVPELSMDDFATEFVFRKWRVQCYPKLQPMS